MEEGGFLYESGLDIGLYIGYFMMFVATLSAVAFPVIHAVKNPKEIAKSGIALVSLLIVFFIAYSLAGGEVTPKYVSLGVSTEFSSKLIGAGLTMFFIVFVIAVIGMIYSEISKSLK
jgi:hypothetical protein